MVNRKLRSKTGISEATDVRAIQLRNVPNVRQQFYIWDICALSIHARCTEVEHKCIAFRFRSHDPNINWSEHLFTRNSIMEFPFCWALNGFIIQAIEYLCCKCPQARHQFIRLIDKWPTEIQISTKKMSLPLVSKLVMLLFDLRSNVTATINPFSVSFSE